MVQTSQIAEIRQPDGFRSLGETCPDRSAVAGCNRTTVDAMDTPIDTSTVLTVSQAAAAAGVSTKTIRRWLHSGRLEAGRAGEAYIITAAALQAAQDWDTVHRHWPRPLRYPWTCPLDVQRRPGAHCDHRTSGRRARDPTPRARPTRRAAARSVSAS